VTLYDSQSYTDRAFPDRAFPDRAFPDRAFPDRVAGVGYRDTSLIPPREWKRNTGSAAMGPVQAKAASFGGGRAV
jgi:hypothetical protein